MNDLAGVLTAVIPSIGVGVLFWFAMRAIMNADRTERRAIARMEREEEQRAAETAAKDSPPSI